MKPIELPKWLVVALVIILVIAIAKIIFSKLKTQLQVDRERLRRQLREINEASTKQSQELSRLASKKEMLDLIVLIRWRMCKTLVGVTVLIAFFAFYLDTGSILTSLSNTVIIVVAPPTFLIFIFSDGLKDINGLIEYLRMKIQLHVYRKNGFNPLEMETLERQISYKQREAEKIKMELVLIKDLC